ncbi:MAG: hypothetical protein J0L57_07990 [Burkholderiales bacterium]|nr:hypothetical protein [Burkholderiales bacterium]
MLRLSDGRTWAREFGASTADELRDGCFEAWLACRMEWQRRAAELPAHQSRKRAAMLATVPTTLQLHVRDTTAPGRGWLNANFGRDATRLLVVRCPGDAPNAEAWDGADWPDAWARCLRTWCAAAELTRFLANLGRELTRELRRHDERIAAELRRLQRGAAPAEGEEPAA